MNDYDLQLDGFPVDEVASHLRRDAVNVTLVLQEAGWDAHYKVVQEGIIITICPATASKISGNLYWNEVKAATTSVGKK